MSNLKSYRACFVPLCSNNTKTTPQKMFFNVPHDVKRRNKWFQAVRRTNPKTTSNYFCCEDHFDLKEDMENYFYYTTMGGRAKMKVKVVPHKFSWQPNRKRHSNTSLRPAAENRRKQETIKETLSESTKNVEINNPQKSYIEIEVDCIDETDVHSATLNITSPQNVSVKTQTNIKHRTVAIQVNCRPKYRNVSVQCKLSSVTDNKTCSPIKSNSMSTATYQKKSWDQKSISNFLNAHKSISSSSFTLSNISHNVYELSGNSGSSTIDSSSLQSPVKKEILKN